MGIVNGSRCGVRISKVSLVDLMSMIRDTEYGVSSVSTIRARVDLKFLHVSRTNTSDSTRHRINKVKNIKKEVSKCGCVDLPVCDP